MSAPTFYIFHGDDIISRDEALRKMRDALGENGDLNRSEFDGAQSSVPEVVSAVPKCCPSWRTSGWSSRAA